MADFGLKLTAHIEEIVGYNIVADTKTCRDLLMRNRQNKRIKISCRIILGATVYVVVIFIV